ncbi:MAG: DJ-1/PfpI family protein [Acidobacteriota bacterium]|nr:DJ-1/PfpI family protein [Acidobacteriota bacterium]
MKRSERDGAAARLARRSFMKGGAGALVAASCLPALGRGAATPGAQAIQGAGAKLYVCPPCGADCDKLTFDRPGQCPGCGMTLIEKALADKFPTVAILLFDHVEIIDFAGPWEVFGGAGYKVFTVAEKTDPVNCVYGQRVVADYTFENSPRSDVLLVPGGGVGQAVNNPRLIKWVQDGAKQSSYVMSVCTGAFILARAGLLDGLTATTVRHAIDNLATAGKNIKTVYDRRYVDNGKVITTAGLSSGIDGAFYLVSKMLGKGTAQQTALGIEYKWEPDSKFARAAYADRYLPNFQGFDAEIISTEGDTERWEIRAVVARPASVAEIMELTRRQIASGTPHTGSPVTFVPHAGPGNDRAEIEWKFKDDEGRGWRGSAVAEPLTDAKDKFVLTLRLARERTPA